MRSSEPSSARSTDKRVERAPPGGLGTLLDGQVVAEAAGVHEHAGVVAGELPGGAGHAAVHDDRVERVVGRVRTGQLEAELAQPLVDGRGGHAGGRYRNVVVGFPPGGGEGRRYGPAMRTPQERAAAFLALHVPGRPLLLPNPWDVGSARLLAHLGFEALATTSGGFAATLGRLDGVGHPRRGASAHGGQIAGAVDVPVSADLENCFADEPEGVAETITLAIGAGLAGGSVEDYTGDRDDPIYPIDLAVAARGGRGRGRARATVQFVAHGPRREPHPRP